MNNNNTNNNTDNEIHVSIPDIWKPVIYACIREAYVLGGRTEHSVPSHNTGKCTVSREDLTDDDCEHVVSSVTNSIYTR